MKLDELIKYELDGKGLAVVEYDKFLWKIQTGYAALIYGSTGIIVSLVSKKIIPFNDQVINSIFILIIGWSIFALILDYSFLASKIRVINDRDKLIEFMYKLAIKEPLSSSETEDLKRCLKNSGEPNSTLSDYSSAT